MNPFLLVCLTTTPSILLFLFLISRRYPVLPTFIICAIFSIFSPILINTLYLRLVERFHQTTSPLR